MSLIERALQRVKAEGKQAGGNVPERSAENAASATVFQPPVVGTREPEIFITDAFLREKKLAAPHAQEHQQRAEYRHIKYGLLRETRRTAANNLIMVTSALQGEGKSFTSFHLAMSLASEQDYTVVLVDGDIIRPSLTRMIGIEERLGLMDAVKDEALHVESLLIPTNIRGLSVLPAGHGDDRNTEHFASTRMRAVMEQLLSVPNRLVVMDTLPLLLTTEARALALLGGQIIMVVRAESTPQPAVKQAIDLLGDANVKLLLNGAVRSKALGYLGFGYGYDYTGNREAGPRESAPKEPKP
jgi:protein-tyrosine kinase